MKRQLDLMIKTRENIYDILNDLSIEELNKIPLGFSNSIFWNIAHIVVTQQLLHYLLTENPVKIPTELIENYKKGTKVTFEASEKEINTVKKLLLELPKILQIDLENSIFDNFKEYPTSYGFVLKNIKDAIKFNNICCSPKIKQIFKI